MSLFLSEWERGLELCLLALLTFVIREQSRELIILCAHTAELSLGPS